MFKKSQRRVELEAQLKGVGNDDGLIYWAEEYNVNLVAMVIEGVISKERQKEMGKKYRNTLKKRAEDLKEYETKYGPLKS